MFYQRYVELCKEKHMAPVVVAKELGLSNAAPTHWKNGKVPRADAIIDVANYFDVSTDYLLGRTNNRNSHKVNHGDVVKVTLKATGSSALPKSVYDVLNKSKKNPKSIPVVTTNTLYVAESTNKDV